jgi:septal ring factor EnvC (AmiA/AmiB activator)
MNQAKKEALERGEDEESIAIPPFSPSELGLTLEIRQKEVAKAANAASKKVLQEEQARLMKMEFSLAEKADDEAAKTAELIKEREKKFKEQQERRDNRISSSDVKEALRGMLSVPPDRLLLRW